MLKKQIDKISRRESKISKSKGSIKYGHSRNLSSYSFHKYSSKKYQSNTKAKKSKNSKKKSTKHHSKSNSFAGVNSKPYKYHQRAGSGGIKEYLEKNEKVMDNKPKGANGKYDYGDLMKKTPVNIFNIRNYNILKSDKSKRESDDRSFVKRNDSNKLKKVGDEFSNNHKVHNFFVFIGNKDGINAKAGRGVQGKGKDEKINLPVSNYQNDYTKKKSYKKEKKYVKLANLMKRQPLREKGRKMSIPDKANVSSKKISNPADSNSKMKKKNKSSNLSSEIMNFSEKIENFTKELKAMRGENITTTGTMKPRRTHENQRNSYLDTEKSNLSSNQNNGYTERSDKTLKIRSNLSGRPLGIFIKTKKKTLEVISELEKTVHMIKSIKPQTKSAQVQTEDRDAEFDDQRLSTKENIGNIQKSFKPISFSNLNIMNLLKEVAKEILIKSKMVNPNIKNLTEFCQKINEDISKKHAKDKDPEKQVLISAILNYYQEQIIFEEALAILQEKKVDLENLFVYAYERLKIKVEDESEKGETEGGETERSFTIVTDASLASVSDFGYNEDMVRLEDEGEYEEDEEIEEDSRVNVFNLEFEKLVREEITEDEEED